jgi:predicted transcriptional regulator
MSELSKTQQAVALVDGGMSAYAAAQKLEISASAISRALARREAAKGRICPCCSQVVRAGFKVNKAVLKK